MNITIAGYGFVGKAHEAVLKDKFDVNIYDPMLGYNNIASVYAPNDVVAPDGAIICVSTPERSDGSCDVNNVADVISRIDEAVPILIKSTISLEGWRSIRELFPDHQLAFSPEFLRAASAIEDFQNTREIYIGGDSVPFWHAIFRIAFSDPNFTSTIRDPESLIIAKYFRNSFLATKVAFFNQVFDLCEATDVSYNEVLEVVGSDPRIGYSHMQITEDRGFGGHCFPKDTSAIIETARKFKSNLTILQEAVNYNNVIRRK